MKTFYYKYIVTLSVIFIALPVLAQESQRTLRDVVIEIADILGGAVMPLLFIFALTWFVWGVVEFIRNADNQEKRQQGRTRMLWGIIALFFMVSFLGVTSIFTETFFNRQPILPQLYEKDNQ